jgi:hypothetical protein
MGQYTEIGRGWDKTIAMTALDNTLYIVYDTTLYMVEAE